ncbi:multidrug resistance protein D [Vibrio ishigakensis]|uniref:Multidrug resistance protein D n=1 Tax=Vibrio ishigakensis TaxID=1481914 RepID=A0A0B8QFT3_9VIBR|nr:multidrug resistance protein D [Vibrio ishigakensis]
MKRKPSIYLMLALLMFPQIVETIYSPALASISDSFLVNAERASQTLSIYFVAFAFGVLFWGVLADKWGRRPTMLSGLALYVISAVVAARTSSFNLLLFARATGAFGIAVGSVVTQTVLRDCFSGKELAKVFNFMGMGIAVSPVLGMLLGGQLVSTGGYKAVFWALFVLAFCLLVVASIEQKETRQKAEATDLCILIAEMLRDRQLLLNAGLVALFNIALFSYYQLGAFEFQRLGLTATDYGYSGIVLGLSTLFGSFLNKVLLQNNFSRERILGVAVMSLLSGALGVFSLSSSLWFLLPMLFVVSAFSLAIPNLLSSALTSYRANIGSAGALFGLFYYLLIGMGLSLSGLVQSLEPRY